MADKWIVDYQSPTARRIKPRLLIVRSCLAAATIFAVWFYIRQAKEIFKGDDHTADHAIHQLRVACAIGFLSLTGLAITFTDFKRAKK